MHQLGKGARPGPQPSGTVCNQFGPVRRSPDDTKVAGETCVKATAQLRPRAIETATDTLLDEVAAWLVQQLGQDYLCVPHWMIATHTGIYSRLLRYRES